MSLASPALLSASRVPAVSRPTRLRLPDLLHATDRAADDVLNGRYDQLLPTGGVPTDRRWFTRVHGDDDIDVWLISWVRGHATELHDHGGSLGALTLLSGSLDEFRWDRGQLRPRRIEAGDQAAFPLGWVHDVVWAPPVAGSNTGESNTGESNTAGSIAVPEPTLSVHAYSPPLTTMSYYDVTDQGTLRRQRTELTDKPESE